MLQELLSFFSYTNLKNRSSKWPLPFRYFENLYFQPSTSTFLSCASSKSEAIAPGEDRGYSFKTINTPIQDAQLIDGTTLILFESNQTNRYLGHFFHLLEHICALWALYGDRHSQDIHLILLASDGDMNLPDDWQGPNEINKHLLQALFPSADVKTWKEFRKDLPANLCFKRAITSDRLLTFSSHECGKINKMLGVARHWISPQSMQRLSHQVHRYAKSKACQNKKRRVTYLKRPPPRALDSVLEQQLLLSIQALQSFSLRIEDFNQISFQEQIEIIGNTDVLISVHGNGLSHILFLPQGAKVIEIFPPSAHALDYKLFADLKGLAYRGILPDRGVMHGEASYQLGAFGDFNVGIDQLDLNLVLSELG